jgi:nitrate reductase delta subunit
MTERRKLFEMFAGLLAYPESGAGYRLRLTDYRGDPQSDFSNHLSAFISATENLSSTDMEELYTRTFDINPISSLEIGWHLYGEAYERGAFLVKMRDMLRQYGVPESTELPDHLVHVLHLLAKMDDGEADAFINSNLLPALRKMLDGFAKQSTPYEHVLRALLALVEQRYPEGVEHV